MFSEVLRVMAPMARFVDPKVSQKTPFRCYFLQVSVKPQRHPERDGSQVGWFFAFLKDLALDPLQSDMHRGGLSAAHQVIEISKV